MWTMKRFNMIYWTWVRSSEGVQGCGLNLKRFSLPPCVSVVQSCAAGWSSDITGGSGQSGAARVRPHPSTPCSAVVRGATDSSGEGRETWLFRLILTSLFLVIVIMMFCLISLKPKTAENLTDFRILRTILPYLQLTWLKDLTASN